MATRDHSQKPGNSKAKQQSKRAKGKIIPLRLAEEIVSYDTLSALQHLEELTQSGDCIGIAFGAILRGGQIAHGYTGAAIEQPVVAAGILSKVIYNLYRDAEGT